MEWSTRLLVSPRRSRRRASGLAALLAVLLVPAAAAAQQCMRTIKADIVALDQPIFYNRLGAFDPAAMIYALRRDVVPLDDSQPLGPGNAILREDKRPRPLTLRMNVGDCLRIEFQNLLAPQKVDDQQPATRDAGVHVTGLQLVDDIEDDGSHVGQNPSSLVAPGGSAVYTLYAAREGTYLMYSTAATTGGEGNGGSLARGLFGAVNVEPQGAVWLRSQVTREELELATRKDAQGAPMYTPAGHPIIDYDAVYPTGHKFAGLPILRMLDANNEIVHSDLTAIITGPNLGEFPPGTYPDVEVLRNRNKPFREFTIIFHDEIGIVQAFPIFEDPQFEFTLHSGRDAFAINYGTGGIGAEILANRFGVGPMGNCNECKYEEFFLSSWTVGDPAMVVDVPANATDGSGELIPGPKATKALYPDDPSNVYHSYMNDHVKIRNLHAGPKEHHIFHLHAHQWLHTPDGDNSSYLDSQAIGPGSGFTYETTYDGSGNRNKTPGDAIFHCHFYPHFAMGMWGLWRVHDVFEAGTELDQDGKPAPGSRALPDGEIAAGTPIPALVPMPTYALAPMPGTDDNPGYPFYIPGIAGHRAPKPPLETVEDGGLPRHVVQGGLADFPELNLLDFSKENIELDVLELPEAGTWEEQAAMAFHAKRSHPTYVIDPVTFTVTADTFITNGLPPVAGAPYADPCVDDFGNATGSMRVYKAAMFQMDVKYNKAGWHHPQHRLAALWADVEPTLNAQRAPEPLFFRANSNDCIQYNLVNLIPHEYEMDDFQVRTPTDVIGQHIHLVKFDVTSSDGSANGFNYEDGSFSPGEVVERIRAIRRFNGCTGLDSGDARDGTIECPVARAHPYFGPGPNNEWVGAQETIQRWFADDVLNGQGKDRTLMTVFTHDHFGPSTHQQAGLYAGLLIEPAGSVWRDPENGTIFGNRFDGGPTSWRADILTANPDSSFREFGFNFSDFTMAYDADAETYPDPQHAINPPGRFEPNPILPDLLRPPIARNACPNGTPPPCPELIAADDPGTMTVNYRNEPIALRIRDPNTNTQMADGQPGGDLSNVFQTNVFRADSRFNVQPNFYPPLTQELYGGDPFTPMMRVYEGDPVQIRVLVGAHEEGHNFSIHGLRWFEEPSDPNSGYRNSQFMGISEHFEFVVPAIPGLGGNKKEADFLYKAGSSTDDLWNGLWGLMRVYKNNAKNLLKLPNNPDGRVRLANAQQFDGICPIGAPTRSFDVTAVLAQNALPGGRLVYNSRQVNGGPLNDPTAILYVRTSDLDNQGKLKPGVPVEPLILRANAGDCIALTLRNRLPNFGTPLPDLDGYNTLPMIVDQFNNNHIRPSRKVGLHAQLLEYDVTNSDGANVGVNPVQTADPGKSVTYQWYAGRLSIVPAGGVLASASLSAVEDETLAPPEDYLVATPVEYGAINLTSSDPIKHSTKGAIGAIIIEPQGSTWIEDAHTRAAATVTPPDGEPFREFVVLIQNDVNLRFGNGDPIPNTADAEDPEDSGQKAVNYRTEPMWFRMGFAPDEDLEATRDLIFTNVLSNAQVGGDPETPVFEAEAGQPIRFRILEPAGHSRNTVFNLHGHIWDEYPWVNGSTRIGENPITEWKGTVTGPGPSFHYNLVPRFGAGGAFGVTGDYLWRDQASFAFDGGIWGILRVKPANNNQ